MTPHTCPQCTRSFESESPPNFCPYGCGPLGYAVAFYELAEMMGIVAQPRAPREVWESEMKPRLKAVLAGDAA